MSEKQQLPSREEVPTALKWDLTLLYPNDEAMEEQLQETVKKARELHQLAGKLAANDGQTLLQALQAAKVINEELEREYVYAFLRRDSDTTDAAATELYGKAATAVTEIETALSFMDPEIVSLDQHQLDQWLTEVSGLSEFKYALEQVR